MTVDQFLNNKTNEDVSCVIYKFTNNVNNKVYIGKTKTSLRKKNNSTLIQFQVY